MDKVRTISMLLYSNEWKYKDKLRIIPMLLYSKKFKKLGNTWTK